MASRIATGQSEEHPALGTDSYPAQVQEVRGRLRLERLAWGAPTDIAAVQNGRRDFDVIVGSDLLYSEESWEALGATLEAFSRVRAAQNHRTRAQKSHRTTGEPALTHLLAPPRVSACLAVVLCRSLQLST